MTSHSIVNPSMTVTVTTHCVSRGTMALPGYYVAHPSVHTQAGLQTTVAVVTMGTGLIAIQPRPPRLTGTFPL